jgi:hypothetical protein
MWPCRLVAATDNTGLRIIIKPRRKANNRGQVSICKMPESPFIRLLRSPEGAMHKGHIEKSVWMPTVGDQKSIKLKNLT